jgi:hypothetical protein
MRRRSGAGGKGHLGTVEPSPLVQPDPRRSCGACASFRRSGPLLAADVFPRTDERRWVRPTQRYPATRPDGGHVDVSACCYPSVWRMSVSTWRRPHRADGMIDHWQETQIEPDRVARAHMSEERPEGVVRRVEADAKARAQSIYLDWLVAGINEDLGIVPDTLWHYTDAPGLLGIVSDQELWATQAWFLNDSSETKYGMDLFLRVLGQVDLSSRPSGTREWVETWLERQQRDVLRLWLESNLELFVTCFCEDGDLLSQWRAYGNGSGYALGFTDPPAQAWVQSAGHELLLRRVIYDVLVQEAACRRIIDALLDFLDTDSADGSTRAAFVGALVDAGAQVASWCKHPSFAEEKEWRVIYPRSEDPILLDRHFRSRGFVIPYVKLALPSLVGARAGRLPLSRVNIGPGSEPELAKRGVEAFLDEFAFNHVVVDSSTAPLRY